MAKPIKSLVSGGAGFIASHVVDALIKKGHEVTVIDNFSTGNWDNLNPKARLMAGDINLLQAIDPDTRYIFHLASLARIQPSISDPLTSHHTNVNGTMQLLELARRTRAKFIFSSSSSVYDNTVPNTEDSPTNPKSPYALQKLIGEQYIQLFAELYDIEYVIFRYFNVFGERQILEGAYAAVVGIFLDQMKKKKPLTITNDGEQRRDFTYVGDVARANLMATKWPNGIYNIGSGKNYSMNELAKLISKNTTNIGERVGEARETLADNSKAVAQGWRPTVDIKDWVKQELKKK